MEKPLYVTKPYLPELAEFIPYLQKIWERRVLTNGGPFHEELEKVLAEYLGVKYVSLFANGTLALMTALQTLRIKGDVITTPFSFAATTHSLLWNDIKPVFCDIEPDTLTLDPNKIVKSITTNTTAIMPVHVYGNPCKMEQIQEIAYVHGLKVIYDAAHSFGVNYKGESILNYGDLSVLSFHATKVFNTFEGGAIICHDLQTKQRIDFLKNFGYLDEVTIVTPGMNAKMNEVQAAMGLLQLKTIDERIENLRTISLRYKERLREIAGISTFPEMDHVKHNYSYFPILIHEELFGANRDLVYEHLKHKNIFARRYFYPLISDFPIYSSLPSSNSNNLPVSTMASQKILCLPNFATITPDEIDYVCDSLIEIQKNSKAFVNIEKQIHNINSGEVQLN